MLPTVTATRPGDAAIVIGIGVTTHHSMYWAVVYRLHTSGNQILYDQIESLVTFGNVKFSNVSHWSQRLVVCIWFLVYSAPYKQDGVNMNVAGNVIACVYSSIYSPSYTANAFLSPMSEFYNCKRTVELISRQHGNYGRQICPKWWQNLTRL